MVIQSAWLGHAFTVHPHSAGWNNVSGIYIFCGVSPQNRWVPLYIGQTDSFRTRIPQHEQWRPAVRLGATHVHAAAVPLSAIRDALEQKLIAAFQPRLNTHHKAMMGIGLR